MMDKTEFDRTPPEGAASAAHDGDVIERREAARRALFERLAKQPAMNIGKWTRDELYDRPKSRR
jgi:hypothetical protein